MGIRDRAKRALASIVRDAWSNESTGLGVYGVDSQLSTQFCAPYALDPYTTGGLYVGDPFAAIVADAVPEQALRRPVKLIGDGADQAKRELKRLRFPDKLKQVAALGRATGGAVAIIGHDDNRDRADPLVIKPGMGIDWIDVYDRRQLEATYIENNPRSQLAGEASVWRVSPNDGCAPFEVHRSRCLFFGGVTTPHYERSQNNGWDYSVYDRIYATLRATGEGALSISKMIADASQGVFKIQGLLANLADPGGQARMRARGAMLDFFRGLTRSILLDADGSEDFSRVPMNFAGVPETVDRQIAFLAAVSQIPVTVLMGQAPAGLNATGDADMRNWYDRVGVYQLGELDPAYQRALEIIAPGVTLEWLPLWQPSAKEEAEIAKLRADTHLVYVGLDAYTGDDVARAEFSGDRKPVLVDMTLREVEINAPDFAQLPESTAQLSITPSDQALLVSVDEARAMFGLSPIGGTDGAMSLAEYKAKLANVVAAGAAAEAGELAPAAPTAAPAMSNGAPS